MKKKKYKTCATKEILSKLSGEGLGVNMRTHKCISMHSHILIQMEIYLRGYLHLSEP